MRPSVVGIIPARAGSKGIRLKNLRKVCGKSLLWHAIKRAKRSKWLDRIIVSTDSRRIAKEAMRCGADVPFLRPKRFSGDKSPMSDVMLHALDFLKNKEGREYDIFVQLQPTSPLRRAEHIDEAVGKLVRHNCYSVISVTEAHEHPIKMMYLEGDRIKKFLLKSKRGLRRQDMPAVYKIDGCVSAVDAKKFMRKRAIICKDTRVIVLKREESIDIDDETDITIAETLMKNEKSSP